MWWRSWADADTAFGELHDKLLIVRTGDPGRSRSDKQKHERDVATLLMCAAQDPTLGE